MRELTYHDLDTQLAEQLPARELMGGGPKSAPPHDCGCGGNENSNNTNWGFLQVNNSGEIANVSVGFLN